MLDKAINVFSEIGQLKRVLLHRPGPELLNLTPQTLERLLFDDIPFLEVAQEEHDFFAQTLKDAGVEVIYLVDLVTETLGQSRELRKKFTHRFLSEAGVANEHLFNEALNYLESINDTKAFVIKTIAGIRKNELKDYKPVTLSEYIDDTEFITEPMPNLYFTRDNFASIGEGITLNHMYSQTRNRETIYAKYVFKYHGLLSKYEEVPFWYDRENREAIEGGDELVLSREILAIGISQRTRPGAIEKFAKNLFFGPHASRNTVKTILAFHIPSNRAFMHLDTVFTQIDYDKFTVHPGIFGPLEVYEITKGATDNLNIKTVEGTLESILSNYLKIQVTLIPCGGGDPVAAAREQWNDASNTLAIAPGEVVVYSRNPVTNKVLEDMGIKLHIIPSSELSRGRGGPRCMSMPLIREDI